MYRPDSPVRLLPGVGPKRAEELSALHISTVGDLLYHFPRAYQNRGQIETVLSAVQSGQKCAMILTVGSEPASALLPGRKTLIKFTAFDETGKVTVTFFNQNYVKSVFKIGQTYRFFGKIERFRGGYTLSAPEFEPVTPARRLPDFYPVYPLTKGISQKAMQAMIRTALAGLDPAVPDPVDEKYRKMMGLCGFSEALRIIHDPADLSELEKARNYFIFEELFRFALGVLEAKGQKKGVKAPVFPINEQMERDFYAYLPFEPTGAQRRVIGEIAADLRSGAPMRRLVSGDVGSGKTVCAAAAAYFAVKSGYQCALMAPTEILAGQHYADLSALLEGSGIRTALLVGSLAPAAKKRVQGMIASGDLDFIIGTHALISAGVTFRDAALVITDEQHRFGLAQRDRLAGRCGRNPESVHVLAMSATPIPRSLALILYGDMDQSAVDEMPPGRRKVSTFLVDESYRRRMEGFIVKQASQGRQTYIVCPAIEEQEDGDDGPAIDLLGRKIEKVRLRSAVEYAATLSAAYPVLRVGCLHGKMKGAEKDRIMGAFAAGELDVLVATTVIEVGVNVPNATLMIVENAERFGLSALHQLRGRVGRGPYKSWCILVSDNPSESAGERLQKLCETSDGYEIAKFDLARRGPGDFFPSDQGGYRQSGELRFRMASLCDNTDTLMQAFAAAKDKLGISE